MGLSGAWSEVKSVATRDYGCGFCHDRVASDRGWDSRDSERHIEGSIRICPGCNQPTFFRIESPSRQVPGPRARGPVRHVPEDVVSLYDEARNAHAAGAFTAAVLACRKVLMHVAVEKDAKEGLSFVEYVEYLDQEKYLGRDGKGWVDVIRTKGNEANHEIVLMDEGDSERTLTLVEMLLKLVYEFPGSLPQPAGP
jgi:hypothetical protein